MNETREVLNIGLKMIKKNLARKAINWLSKLRLHDEFVEQKRENAIEAMPSHFNWTESVERLVVNGALLGYHWEKCSSNVLLFLPFSLECWIGVVSKKYRE